MKTLVALLLALTFAACDYTVRLTPEPKVDVDPAWLGVWEMRPEAGAPERLLLLPLGPREYLMSYPAGKPDAMFARVCRTGAGENDPMQITWIGTAKGKVPEDGRVYQYAAAALKNGVLTVRLINGEATGRDAKTADELSAAIAAAKDKPELYRAAMVFRKVSGQVEPDE
jgi:hypothetical protein